MIYEEYEYTMKCGYKCLVRFDRNVTAGYVLPLCRKGCCHPNLKLCTIYAAHPIFSGLCLYAVGIIDNYDIEFPYVKVGQQMQLF